MNSPFLIAVSSCQSDAAKNHNQAVRETWGKAADESGVDYILTIGNRPAHLNAHEVACDAPDDYINLGHKTQFNARYAVERGYQWMVQCFTDSYLSIPRLLGEFSALGAEAAIVGNFFFTGVEEDHPCGGSGYWIRRDALELVARSPLTPAIYAHRRHAEDRWVSWVCRQAGFGWRHDPRYDHESHAGGVSLHNQNVSNHLSFSGHRYNPDWQYDEQRQELTGEPSRRALAGSSPSSASVVPVRRA